MKYFSFYFYLHFFIAAFLEMWEFHSNNANVEIFYNVFLWVP
jgi:hypothetical protein